jgi:hypothetical protein
VYGAEQGFAGACDYTKITGGTQQGYNAILSICNDASYSGQAQAVSRQSMFTSAAWKMRSLDVSVNSLASIGPFPPRKEHNSTDWRVDPFTQTSSFVYTNTRRLVEIRKSCQPLRRGNTFIRYSSDNGLLAYSRIAEYEIVTLLNLHRNDKFIVPSYTIVIDSAMNPINSEFTNILNPGVKAWTKRVGSATVLDFGDRGLELDMRGYAIFVPSSRIGRYNQYWQTNICSS